MKPSRVSRTWFDPTGRRLGYGRVRWLLMDEEAARDDLKKELHTWTVACWSLFLGGAAMRLFIGHDYGYDEFGEHRRSGPDDTTVVLWGVFLGIVRWWRGRFLGAAYSAWWADKPK